jgi:hypothetical protein
MQWRSTLAALGCLLFATAASGQEVVAFEADARVTQSAQGWVKLLDETGLTSDKTRDIAYMVPTWARTMQIGSWARGATCAGCIVAIFHMPPGETSPATFDSCGAAQLGAIGASATCVLTSYDLTTEALSLPALPWEQEEVTQNLFMPGNFVLRHSAMTNSSAATRIIVYVRFMP